MRCSDRGESVPSAQMLPTAALVLLILCRVKHRQTHTPTQPQLQINKDAYIRSSTALCYGKLGAHYRVPNITNWKVLKVPLFFFILQVYDVKEEVTRVHIILW